jgi:hypothetical protein
MLYKPIFTLIAAFAGVSKAAASASPLSRRDDGDYPPAPAQPIPIDNCTSGLCCSLYTAPNDPNASILLTQLNINMSQISPQAVGLGCFPFGQSW